MGAQVGKRSLSLLIFPSANAKGVSIEETQHTVRYADCFRMINRLL